MVGDVSWTKGTVMNSFTKSLRLAVVVAAMLPSVASAALLTYTADLSGDQHTPTVMTDATGTATLRVDDVAQTLSFQMDVSGIYLDDLWDTLVAAPVGPIHLHDGDVGVNGPVVIPFAFDLATYSATASGFSLNVSEYSFADAAATSGTDLGFDEYLARLNARGSYINIHTNDFNSGEIRGQLAAVPLPASVLMLAGGLAAIGGLRRPQRQHTA